MNRRAFAASVGASVAGSMLGACSPAAPRALPGEPPSLSYDDSVRAIRAVIAHDAADTTLIHDALPRLHQHGAPVENAVILFHGFTNCPQQFDLLARQFYARGCNVYVPRLPRHGRRDRLTTTLADLTIEELGKSTLDAFAFARGLGRRVSSVGLSLGGSMSLWLAQAMPIDLAVACRCMMRPRNRLYHRYILDLMKVEATGEGAVVSAAERAGIMEARTVWDYDDVFIAPRYGFASAEDYYERCRPTRFMAGVRVPTLVMSALDDPWIPGALYRDYDWRSNPSLTPLLPESGGHVGFHGTSSRQPWSDLAVARFFEHA